MKQENLRIIEVSISGLRVRLGLRFEQTVEPFHEFIVDDNCNSFDICVTDEDVIRYPTICPSGVLDYVSEFYILMAMTSEYLLLNSRALFHGVSFLWRGRAWIITAESGVGKTTQLRHWQRLFGDEIEVINGDKCILRLENNGSIFVDPSPWAGKEGDMGFTGGELAGIICLEQALENNIERIFPRNSVLRVFSQFLFLADNAAQVHAVARIEDAILSAHPV